MTYWPADNPGGRRRQIGLADGACAIEGYPALVMNGGGAAAAGSLATIPLTWRWKLQQGAQVDLTPSLSWPAPIITHEVEHDRGPVLVTALDHPGILDPDFHHMEAASFTRASSLSSALGALPRLTGIARSLA